jgi:uncharacterized membrane protein
MKKRAKILFIIGGFIWLCGLIVVCMGLGIPENFMITETHTILLKIGGALGMIFGFLIIILAVFRFFKENTKLSVENDDERNIAIRGKAAEKVSLITSILFVVLSVVFIFINSLAGLLITIATLIYVVSYIVFFVYYSKKM